MTKGEGGDQKPFGSAYWFNSVRGLWFAKRAEAGPDPSIVDVGFYPRKFNLGVRPGAHALRFTFGDDVTGVCQIEAADVASLAAGMSIRERIRHALKPGARTVPELAAELDSDPETISRTIRRYSGDKARTCLFFKLPDERIGLAERRS